MDSVLIVNGNTRSERSNMVEYLERNAAILKSRISGKTYTEIAKVYNLSASRVEQICKKMSRVVERFYFTERSRRNAAIRMREIDNSNKKRASQNERQASQAGSEFAKSIISMVDILLDYEPYKQLKFLRSLRRTINNEFNKKSKS